MSRLDLIIFGATGFTGKHAVGEMARLSKKYPELTWGVAGRSQKKIDDIMTEMSKKSGEDLSHIKTYLANVDDEDSLRSMCSQTKVIVDCCGPYRLYGEPVVKAAIDSKTHYVDVNGEPQFMEKMQLKYDAAARDAGVYVVGACGFDSIPNDMGVVFLEKNFGGTLNSVESYLSSDIPSEYRSEAAKSGIINFGTWESLVHSLANKHELGPLRKALFPTRLPTFKPKLKNRSVVHRRDGGWCLPFPGADNSVVYRSQRYLYENKHKRPVQFRAYVSNSKFVAMLFQMFVGLIIYAFTRTQFTTKLLLDYPRLLSLGMVTKEGPKDVVSDNVQFKFELHGSGWESGADVDNTPPNKKVVARISGKNPGYGATVTALLFSAITILKESHKFPASGGVLTTGAAFYETDIVKNLTENNLKFEIVGAK